LKAWRLGSWEAGKLGGECGLADVIDQAELYLMPEGIKL
jgi:hypothetical protein